MLKRDIDQKHGLEKAKFIKFSCIASVLVFALVFFGLALVNTPNSDARSASMDGFDPGHIIDDSIFYNSNAMTLNEIQALMDREVPACDMWGEGPVGGRKYPDGSWVPAGTTRAQYAKVMRERFGKSHYHEPPYVCVDMYYQNPETGRDIYDSKGKIEDGMISSAQIVYNAAHEYGINPQVLLVMLAKESLNWRDNWPLHYEYNTVMGYGCPDGAPCATEYFGFYNQVNKAAWQMKYYREHIYSYNYRPGMTNNILYHPNRGCGAKSVDLVNSSTTSLYIYTPYTPNDAALDAYPGVGNDCSSYGNRNFYGFFKEWFGGTRADDLNSDADSGVNNPELQQLGKQEVATRLDAVPGLAEKLGKETAQINCRLKAKDACVQAYEQGVVIYHPDFGTWENFGSIRDKFLELGSVDGKLGFPIGPMNCKIGHEGACVQAYQGGVIISSPETGAWENTGEIRAKFVKLGSVDGHLGFPIGPVNCEIGHAGACVQAYQGGVIISNSATGTWENYGKIREGFRERGGVDGFIGFPTSDVNCDEEQNCMQTFEHATLRIYEGREVIESAKPIYDREQELVKNGKDLGKPLASTNYEIGHKDASVQAFEKGVIISHPKAGAWENYGQVREEFLKVGGVDGAMGFPISGVDCNDKGNCVQSYQNATLRIYEDGKVIESAKPIYDREQALVKDGAGLGKPLASTNYEIGHKDASVQAFEKGVIISHPKAGTWENYGDIRERFIALGSVDGKLGFPTSPMNCKIGHEGACVQAYERGAIISNPATGTWENIDGIRKKFVELGSVDGELGFPTGPMNCKIGHKGACVQAYEHGVIISHPKVGTWENSGKIREKFLSLGGVDGKLGFPTSDIKEEQGKKNTLVQHYEGGSIRYNTVSGEFSVTY